MSIESDFRALLAANAGVAALVSTRIAQNAVPAGSLMPLIVFGAVHDRTLSLDNTLQADRCQLVTQCWAETAVQADAVADAVVAAVATAPAAACAVVLERSASFDAEQDLHATELTVEWWA
jgi:hypothetical protein